MGKIDAILHRYRELSACYGHAPRRAAERPAYDNAQRELWALAQAICQLTQPTIQAELDAARRDAIAQIRLHVERVSPVAVYPRPRQRPVPWTEFQLTPELSVDPSTTGACVTTDVARRLHRAHKLQVSIVINVVHSR